MVNKYNDIDNKCNNDDNDVLLDNNKMQKICLDHLLGINETANINKSLCQICLQKYNLTVYYFFLSI